MSRLGNHSPDTTAHVGRPQRVNLVDEMAAYDSLPEELKVVIRSAPLPVSALEAAECISRMGPVSGAAYYLRAMAIVWHRLDSTPLRP